MGFLFSIVRFTQAQYEQYLSSDGSGLSFFAKDAEYYYGWATATDVQFYRSGGVVNTESSDWEAWVDLCENLSAIKNDFTARNNLTPYSDDEFWDRDFTYDGAHLYLTFYPYANNRSDAEQQGINWQDVSYTLVLSQPATQGEAGIWCVERWYDTTYGNLYIEFPATSQPAAAYYAVLQKAADTGTDTALLDPVSAAVSFAKTKFDYATVTVDSFSPVNGEPAGNVLRRFNVVFDDMGTLQKLTNESGKSYLSKAYGVPSYYNGPLSNYTGSSLYPILWIIAQAPSSISGNAVICRNSGGEKTLTFYKQDSLLCVETDGTQRWYKPAYPYNKSPYDRMLSYYEEFQAAE
ncbi:hypothetical protein AAFA46_04065 [Oscillospiraceae bacterium WX1]